MATISCKSSGQTGGGLLKIVTILIVSVALLASQICAYTDADFEEVSLFNKMFYIFKENLHFLLPTMF